MVTISAAHIRLTISTPWPPLGSILANNFIVELKNFVIPTLIDKAKREEVYTIGYIKSDLVNIFVNKLNGFYYQVS